MIYTSTIRRIRTCVKFVLGGRKKENYNNNNVSIPHDEICGASGAFVPWTFIKALSEPAMQPDRIPNTSTGS